MSYLLSIIIPEKDRYKYLVPLIHLIKSFDSDEIELVIQDNSENNSEILKFIESISFKHLKYFHHKDKLSVVQNTDKAVINSTGEYVCCIGDDDGVSRNIIDCVKWMKKNNVDSLRSRIHTYYSWPDSIINPGTLSYENANLTFEYLDPVEQLNNVCKIGMQSIGLMPRLYHGIVRRDILDKIYKIGGTHFPGAAGDMANAVALCFNVNKFVVVDFHVTIPGSSIMHGGGIVKRKNQMAKLSEVDFISKDVAEKWENKIPPLWHTCFVWPESASKALKYISREDIIDKINYDYMLANFLTKLNLSFLGLCLKHSNNKLNFFKYLIKLNIINLLILAKAIISFFTFWDRRLIYSVKRENNIETIIEAEALLYKKTGNIKFDKLIKIK